VVDFIWHGCRKYLPGYKTCASLEVSTVCFNSDKGHAC